MPFVQKSDYVDKKHGLGSCTHWTVTWTHLYCLPPSLGIGSLVYNMRIHDGTSLLELVGGLSEIRNMRCLGLMTESNAAQVPGQRLALECALFNGTRYFILCLFAKRGNSSKTNIEFKVKCLKRHKDIADFFSMCFRGFAVTAELRPHTTQAPSTGQAVEFTKRRCPGEYFSFVSYKLFQILQTLSQAKRSHERYETKLIPTNKLPNSLSLADDKVLQKEWLRCGLGGLAKIGNLSTHQNVSFSEILKFQPS